MTDEKTKRGKPDNQRIDIHDPSEVSNWSKALNISPQKLKLLVEGLGTTSAKKIREFLQDNPDFKK